MAKYLVVTHQTALSPALLETVRRLAAADGAAEFAVLVPEAPVGVTTWEGETVDGAKQRGETAKALFEEAAHARVSRTAVGAPDPMQAIADELLAQPDYETLVICTLPPGMSRWLRMDLVHRVERRFGGRVIHVVADAPVKAHA